MGGYHCTFNDLVVTHSLPWQPGCLSNSPLIGAKKNPMLTMHYSLVIITAAAYSESPSSGPSRQFDRSVGQE